MAVRAVAGSPARSLVRAVPVWAWLTAIVAVSAVARLFFALRIDAPWIVVDELIYSELARGLAAGDGFAIRGVATHGYGLVYPLVIAPAYLLFDSLPHAYAAVKTINAVAMSLAALPAYFLARRVLPVGLSLFAAVLAVALPSLLYAGEVMTENVFYPIFLTVVLVFVLTLERPTPARQLLLLGCCVVAYLTRAQALAFFPAIVVAPVVLGTWRSFRVLYGTLGGAALVALVAQLVRGESPLGLLGAYSVAGDYALRAGRGAALARLPRRRARPLRRRLPVRGAARAARALEPPAAKPAPVPRRDRDALDLPAARGVRVRVAPVGAADRGAQPLLSRAADADRAARLGRPGRAAAAAHGRRGGGARGGAPGGDPVRAADRRAEPVGHVADARALARARALGRARRGRRGGRRVLDPRCARVPARAAAVRDRASARRARVLPGGRAADLGADGVRGRGRARRGNAQAGPRVGRQGRGGSRRGRRALDRQRLALLGLAERVLQPQRRPRLLRGHADGGRAPCDEGDARPQHRRPARRSRRAVRAHGRIGRARRRRRREGRRAQRLPVRGRSLRCGRPRSSRACTPRTRGRARA